MLNSQVPGEAARHAAAVLLALFLGFLCVYVRLRAREKPTPALPRWSGPVSLGWAITVGSALLLILATFWALHLHHRLSLTELVELGSRDSGDGEADRARRRRDEIRVALAVRRLDRDVALLDVHGKCRARQDRRDTDRGRERADVATRILLQVLVKMILIAHDVLSLRLLLRRRIRRRPAAEYTGSGPYAPTLPATT
jgi:hypothetical protein